jgi:hypothetical protein
MISEADVSGKARMSKKGSIYNQQFTKRLSEPKGMTVRLTKKHML